MLDLPNTINYKDTRYNSIQQQQRPHSQHSVSKEGTSSAPAAWQGTPSQNHNCFAPKSHTASPLQMGALGAEWAPGS